MLPFSDKFTLWLAPMEAVTDGPFRTLCKRHGADVLVSEFISSDALVRNKSLNKMSFEPSERPTGIQIFGSDEKTLREAAEIAARQKPDFIDINWGCPVKKIVNRGAGSGILRDIPKMVALTSAVVRAMEPLGLPVTVKTRLGWDETSKPIVGVAERLQDVGISGISIHGRTRSQLYAGKADWTLIGEVKSNPRMKIPVFGNGDIDSREKALEARDRYGVDGVLIGRAAIGNPWVFSDRIPDYEERKQVCLDLFRAEIEAKAERAAADCDNTINRAAADRPPIGHTYAEHDNPAGRSSAEYVAAQEMKIHYSGLFRTLPHFKPIKVKLMLSSSLQEVEQILSEYRPL